MGNVRFHRGADRTYLCDWADTVSYFKEFIILYVNGYIKSVIYTRKGLFFYVRTYNSCQIE